MNVTYEVLQMHLVQFGVYSILDYCSCFNQVTRIRKPAKSDFSALYRAPLISREEK